MSEHEHRMDQDGTGWKAALAYGRHARDFWSSEVNRAVVADLAPEPGETVLDIGAGFGAAAFVAAHRVAPHGRVWAVEPTPFMRRTLRLRARTNRHGSRVEVVDAVAEQLPIPDGRVDAALAVNVLHHISDLEAAVAELRRVLAPGGRVVLLDEDFDDPSHPDHEEMQQRHGHHHGGDHHHHEDEHGHHGLMVDVEQLGRTMESFGFAVTGAGNEIVAGCPARVLRAHLAAGAAPAGRAPITPYLTVLDTRAAIAWYERHLGAKVRFEPVEMPDGRIGHAEIEIAGGEVMLADEFPEMGVESPLSRGGTSVSLLLWVDDADRVVDSAVADGARLERPVELQPHGARAGWIVDPFGHRWNVSTAVEDLSPSEVRRRVLAAMGGS